MYVLCNYVRTEKWRRLLYVHHHLSLWPANCVGLSLAMQNTAPYRPSFSFEALPALAVATRMVKGPWLGWIEVRPVIRVPAKCLTLTLNAQVLRRFESDPPIGPLNGWWVGQVIVNTVLQGLPRMGWFQETRPTFTIMTHVFFALVGDAVKVRPVIWVVAEAAAFFIFQALCLHFWQRLLPIPEFLRDVGEIKMAAGIPPAATGAQEIGLARPQILPVFLHAHRLLRTALCLRLTLGVLNAASIKLLLEISFVTAAGKVEGFSHRAALPPLNAQNQRRWGKEGDEQNHVESIHGSESLGRRPG